MSAVKKGDLICTSKAQKCIHKRNATMLGGSVRLVICDIKATPELCVYAGQEVKAEWV